jgi:hypothetical protein
MSPLGKPVKLVVLVAALMGAIGAEAAEVRVLGLCAGTVGPKSLLASWRTHKPTTYASARDQVLLTVCNTASPESTWRIDIRRSDLDWPQGVKLRVRRTGDGMGDGLVAGGRGYMEVGASYRTLCTGMGDRANVPLQFELTGVRWGIPVGTHATTITYTIVEIGG